MPQAQGPAKVEAAVATDLGTAEWQRVEGLGDASFRALDLEELSSLVLAVCVLKDFAVLHEHDMLGTMDGRHRKTVFFRKGHPVPPAVA